MIIVLNKKYVVISVFLLVLILLLAVGGLARPSAPTEEFDFKIFVAGIGTVMGKWSGSTGVAVIGVETKTGREKGQELKVIDLLVANKSSVPVQFSSEVNLINGRGSRHGLTSRGQPEVIVGPGAISQGTVIISVPANAADQEWTLEIKGGNLEEGIRLPLQVLKAVPEKPAQSG